MKKKIVILWHNGGRLANQLWLYVSVCAYALEQKYGLENHSFFEYSDYFGIPQDSWVIKLLFFRPFSALRRLFPKKQGQVRKYFFKYYKVYVKCVEFFHKKDIVFAPDGEISVPHYLKPSPNPDPAVSAFEKSDSPKLYLDGWLFRNPAGIEKYRKDIITFFQPKGIFLSKIQERLGSLRGKYKHVVGVHVRQGDYKYLWGGRRYFNEREISEILHRYLDVHDIKKDDVVFVFASDGKINLVEFSDLNAELSGFTDPVEDLFFLASTDVIIGSDSTFGAFASYYGDIPFIVFQKDGVDWGYYKNKTGFFPSKYSQTVCY